MNTASLAGKQKSKEEEKYEEFEGEGVLLW